MDAEAETRLYGILLGESELLKYLDLEKGKTRDIIRSDSQIYDIKTANGEVFYGGQYGVLKSLSKKKIKIRDYNINAICEHKGTGEILDGGPYGLYNTLRNKRLISERQLRKRDIISIVSLMFCPEGKLYCEAFNRNKDLSIINVSIKKGCKYMLEEEIMHIPYGSQSITRAELIPAEDYIMHKGKKHRFSILTCSKEDFFEIDKEKVQGMEEEHCIKRFRVLTAGKGWTEIAYSSIYSPEYSEPITTVRRALIDIRNKKIIKNEILFSQKKTEFTAVEPVTDEGMHDILKSM